MLLGCLVLVVTGHASLRLGVERFVETYQDSLRGRRVAVLTHAAARLPDGRLSLELLIASFRVVAIWTPEHGFWGVTPAGLPVPDDTVWGIPSYSLYGARRRPSMQLLQGVEAVVVDVQDVGFRPYTYLSTLYAVMDACADQGIPVYVLDRPNPLGGTVVEGAVLDTALRSFVGVLPIPYRHGCTIGELARMLNEAGWLPRSPTGAIRRCSLVIVPMQGWKRTMVWEETGLPWFPPSPNISTPTAARAAVITGAIGEMGLWSIGIGTPTPFQFLGAPGFPAERFAKALRTVLLPLGVRIGVARFLPQQGRHARQVCDGIFLVPEARHDARFFAAFVAIATQLRQMAPGFCHQIGPQAWDMLQKVLGHRAFAEALCSAESLRPWLEHGIDAFQLLRQRYLLYA
ncbi:MAG: DUF1343 domain-containing protein [Candidatus Kapabacteria bacterium]|nr:DUF1343 domain-containing protein [Candidatus Kapabacteria bacterium]